MITVTNIHIRIINTIVTTRAVAVASGVLADLSPPVVAIARPLLQHMWRQAGHRDPEFCTECVWGPSSSRSITTMYRSCKAVAKSRHR